MKPKALKITLLILLGLHAFPFQPSANAQGLVSLSGRIKYTTDGTTLISVPVGNPATIGTYGQLNVAVVYSPSASSGLFSATTASALSGDWVQAAPVAHRINPIAGNLTVNTVTVGDATPEETFVVAWTGTYTTWNAAWAANTWNNILFGWSGSALSGGSLGWSQDNGTPPNTPTPILSGAGGFAGMVLAQFPPPVSITTQPASMSVVLGSNATFTVVAPGAWWYEWMFNGSPIYGFSWQGTLTITSAQYTNAGVYSVLVGDDYTEAVSSNAVLQVLPFGGPSIQINNQLAVGTVPAVGSALLSISGGFTNGFIFYTLDGTTPTTNSLFYTGPVTLIDSATVQAMGLSADSTQTAVSPAVTVQITPAYSLQTSVVGSGTISVNPTNAPYASNTVVVLTANAGTGWAFDHWAGDVTGSQNPVSLAMNGPRSVQAVFQVAAPPSITQQPQGATVPAGTVVNLSVSVSGSAPLSYQWLNNSGSIVGATNATYTLNPVQTNNAGGYFVVVTNQYGVVTSAVATVTVYVPVSISTQPASRVVPAWSTVSFNVVAGGYPAPSYQWTFWGTNLPGAVFSTLTITNVLLAKTGDYAVLVGNGYSSQLSDTATLSMSPSITVPYIGATAIRGRSATLSVGAIGTGDLWYQWYKDGVAIDGATTAALSFTNIQFTNDGYYSVVVSSLLGSITNSAQLVVNLGNAELGMCAGIVITGAAGSAYEIQYSTDLSVTNAWVTLTNLTLQQPVEVWVDTSVSAFTKAHRYYRILPGP